MRGEPEAPLEAGLRAEREVYALGTTAGGDESFDAGYFVGLRRAAHERGLCSPEPTD
jgi:hypothetical protein